MAIKVGFYAGSFDPITNGHLAVLEKASLFLDRLVVGVGIHASKVPFFPVEERVHLIQAVLGSMVLPGSCQISCISFQLSSLEAAKRAGACVLIRGVRDSQDFPLEMQMAHVNLFCDGGIPTVFIPASPELSFLSSHWIQQLAELGQDLSAFVPPIVAQALRKKGKPSSPLPSLQ